jgi:hypothetical protein
MSTVQEIEQAALKLPRKKRVLLAERLMESLETKREKEIAEAWAAEAVARAAAYRAGNLKAVPLREAFGFEV